MPTVRLADYMGEEVDLLKLDVEGAAWDILEDLCQAGMLESRLGRILDALDRFGSAVTFP